MAKRKGNQKPTLYHIPRTSKSRYKEAIDLYNSTGRTAQKWQVYLMKAILSRNRKGLWEYTKFGYSLPRRNGKNEIVAIRELFALVEGEKVLHTAHRTTTSHSAWERLIDLLEKAKIEYTSLRATGRESIKVGEGSVEFRTRSSKGGLGEGFDLLVIDEAQEYTEDQESALKYVVTDSKNPQTIFCGTPPTPISSGTVFTNLRNKILAGGVKNAGWAEWSVEDEHDPYDKEAWYLTNPSLGTIFTERSIEDEIGTDDIDFNIQRLGLWIKYNQKSAISENDWDILTVKDFEELDGSLYAGIKYGRNGANAALSIALKTKDDKIFIECIDCQSVRNGNEWIIDFLRNAPVKKIVVDGAGNQNILAADMREYGLKKPILPTVKEIIIANSKWEKAIFDKTICHAGQPSLREVAVNCKKRYIGSQGGFGYEAIYEEHEIALMDSAMLAHWICSTSKQSSKQIIRY